MKLDPRSTPITKNNSKWIKDLNSNYKTPSRKQGKLSLTLALAMIFLDMTNNKSKNKQLGLYQTESFCTAK